MAGKKQVLGPECIRSVAETAGRLGVSEKTIRREIKLGNLGAVRLGPSGRRIGVTETEIRRYLALRSIPSFQGQ